MVIYKALIKHSFSKFRLEILEYCAAEKCLEREQYYLDLLKPEYNILKVAGSPFGYKHSPEAIAKMKNRILTEEQKAKRLEQLQRLNSSPEHEEQLNRLHLSMKGRARPEGSGKPSVSIEVFDTLTDKITIYPSISEAARAIGVTRDGINKAFKRTGDDCEAAATIWIQKKRYRITILPPAGGNVQ